MKLDLPVVWRAVLVIVSVALAIPLVNHSFRVYEAEQHLDRAHALLPLGRYDDALEQLQRAERLTPDDARIARSQGRVNYLLYAFRQDQRFARRAHDAYREATRRNPLDAFNFHQLGQILLVTGEPDNAELAFARALELDPHNVAYLFSLGQLYERQGRTTEARELYRRALDVRYEPEIESRLRALSP